MQKSARPRTQDVDPPWKRALDQNVRFLQDNLRLTESIFAYLIKEKVLSREEIDMIKKSARPRTQDVDPPWKRALEQNVRYLQDNLLLTESIFAYLIKEKVLSREEIDMIKMSSDSEHGRTIELINFLKKRNEDCFEKFLYVLHATSNEFVAEKLEQSMPPQSRRGSSRQSISSDETDLRLQTKDRQIRELESRLAAKDRRIKELENVNEKLKSRVNASFTLLREEMRINDHYKNTIGAFNDELQSGNEMEPEINKKDERLKEAVEKVEELQLRVDELEDELECVREDLRKKKDKLSSALENERQTKKRLGLNEDASDREVMEHLQKCFTTRSELKRAQDELEDINRTKMDLDDCVKTLAHQKDSLQLELSQKRLEIERIRRSNLYSAIPKWKRDPPPLTRRQQGLLERSKALPIIDVNAYPQLPDPVGPMPSIPTTRRRLLTARFQPSIALETQRPKLERRKTLASMEDRETKYCVICRRNYYLKTECRIHVEPFAYGRFSCCGSEDNNCVGCKTVNHLYIHFTGLGKEYIFYDDRGRSLDFKDQWETARN